MNDQAKRWTARGTFIASGDRDVAEAINRYTGEASEIATRLAACADLLRGVEDLDAVAVLAWADVEKVRAELSQLIGHGHTSGFARRCADRALELMPVPPKGGA